MVSMESPDHRSYGGSHKIVSRSRGPGAIACFAYPVATPLANSDSALSFEGGQMQVEWTALNELHACVLYEIVEFICATV